MCAVEERGAFLSHVNSSSLNAPGSLVSVESDSEQARGVDSEDDGGGEHVWEASVGFEAGEPQVVLVPIPVTDKREERCALEGLVSVFIG